MHRSWVVRSQVRRVLVDSLNMSCFQSIALWPGEECAPSVGMLICLRLVAKASETYQRDSPA